MSNVTLIGLDTAKSIFHIYAVNNHGIKVFQRELRRNKLIEFLTQQPPCVVALETCSASYHWARKITAAGHTAKLISARRVKQFSSRNKNDFNDARAITKAARDSDTYFVPPKTLDQQSIQAIHTLRNMAIKHQTALVNSIRSLLAEFGLIVCKGRKKLLKEIPFILEDAENDLTPIVKELIFEQREELAAIEAKISKYDRKIRNCLKSSEKAQRLESIPGVGPLISTALTYMIAAPNVFKNGRNCAAWLGLTPKECSTGGKQRLGGISCEGNSYLRKILVQGSQAMLQKAHKRKDPLSVWASKLKAKKGNNLAAIAVANKVVRIAWAMLAKGEEYNYKPKHNDRSFAVAV